MRKLLKIALIALVPLAGFAAFDRLAPASAAPLNVGLQRSLGGLEAKTLDIPGFTVAYLEGGKADGEPLVMIHGIGADKDNFSRVAPFLRSHYRLISIDLPGFGDSSKPLDADYGIDAQAQRLDQILAALNLTQAHLAGSSMGGWIIGHYAARHPDKAQSLWMLGSAGVLSAPPSEILQRYRQSGEFMLFARTPEEYERILDTVFVARPYLPYSVLKVLGDRAIANYPLHTRIFADLVSKPQPVLEGELMGSTVPALLVWGDQDRAVSPAGAEILHKVMPRSEVVIMPGVGHLPMLESPYRSAQDYLAFRKRLQAS
ncbi:MAG TPA: alpha/beta hydrolase [Solimonas sp.]|nr:alpha/beta hydrolase [Solimonas sp.]